MVRDWVSTCRVLPLEVVDGAGAASDVGTGTGELLGCSGSVAADDTVGGVGDSLRGFCEGDIFSDV